VQFSDASPRIGDWIIAIGNPFGLGGTVTAGIISARDRDLPNRLPNGLPNGKDLLQIDAPVNKGNSGGPTFDLGGRVVGVNTMIISPTGGSVGLAFAIPAATVKRVVEQLKDKGSVTRGWLGIQFQSVSPEIADSLGLAKSSGVLAADVRPGSPGANAGIGVGDLVRTMNGRAVENANAFNHMLDDTAPGARIVLGVAQNGRETFIDAVVGDTPAPIEAKADPPAVRADPPGTERQPLGLSLMPADSFAGTEGRGAMVVGIDPGGIAAGRGISLGDLILDVGSQAVATPEEVYKIVADARKAGKQSILLRIKLGEVAQFIALPIA
jgi:serine protease Do